MGEIKSLLAGITVFAVLFGNAAPVFAQLGGVVTPPADTTPPVISGVATTVLLPATATLVWTTNELSVSTFEYGTTQIYGSFAALGASAAIGGTAVLTGLSPATAYYYCIHATDASGNASQSCASLTTAPAPDTTPPVPADIHSQPRTAKGCLLRILRLSRS